MFSWQSTVDWLRTDLAPALRRISLHVQRVHFETQVVLGSGIGSLQVMLGIKRKAK